MNWFTIFFFYENSVRKDFIFEGFLIYNTTKILPPLFLFEVSMGLSCQQNVPRVDQLNDTLYGIILCRTLH